MRFVHAAAVIDMVLSSPAPRSAFSWCSKSSACLALADGVGMTGDATYREGITMRLAGIQLMGMLAEHGRMCISCAARRVRR